MTNWIKIEEKLPDTYSIADRDILLDNGGTSHYVLIFDGENIGIGYYESEYNIEDDPEAFEDQTELFSRAAWHSQNHMNCCHSGFPLVTHWQPLPPPPKDE